MSLSKTLQSIAAAVGLVLSASWPMPSHAQSTQPNDTKAVMADKSLSTYAHNIKIISQNGIVTLKGPVRTDEEVKSIMSKAVEVAGSPDKVVNEMSVKP
jgi:osmotically-inducible protein OsmY